MHVDDLPTPALLVDRAAFEHNRSTMSAAWPGDRLRPHVKAFKSTDLARRLAEAGHGSFCCATAREVEGMAAAGLGDDLLLANELLDGDRLRRLAELHASGTARVTVAVDSDETVDAAAAAGIAEVLVDVNVGLPRCGCRAEDAPRLADRARAGGLTVRGVMGYEGHVVAITDPAKRARATETAMSTLVEVHDRVGGDVISGGSSANYAENRWVTELQAGSYLLMDSDYQRHGLPFRQALRLWTTVISVGAEWAVCDGGLKSLGMDHGNPSIDHADVFIVSDEHITFVPEPDHPVGVGDRVAVVPSHVDPTVARHERLHLVDGGRVVDVWEVDLRHW